MSDCICKSFLSRIEKYTFPTSGIRLKSKKVKTILDLAVTLQSRVAGTSLVAAWGFGRFAKEASAGAGCDSDRKFCLRKERREALAPAPATEKSAPYDSERSARAPRPGHLLALPSNPTHGLGPLATEWLHLALKLSHAWKKRSQDFVKTCPPSL
jgi:hypothetical protein